MRDHSAYDIAKAGERDRAALALVYDLISDDAVDEIRGHLRGREPRIVGVHAEEAGGRNKIPMAYAEALAHILDLPTDPGIVQSSVANHGGAPSVYHRMVSQPWFDGYVEPGQDYLIVDDMCTIGGALTNLKGFIEHKEGFVICMSVLARRNVTQPYYISLAEHTLAQLKYKHPKARNILARGIRPWP